MMEGQKLISTWIELEIFEKLWLTQKIKSDTQPTELLRKWYNTYIKPLSHTTTWLCVTDGQVTHDYYLPQPIQSILSHDHTHQNKDGHITCYRQTDWLKLHCSRRIWLWANFGPLTLVRNNSFLLKNTVPYFLKSKS